VEWSRAGGRILVDASVSEETTSRSLTPSAGQCGAWIALLATVLCLSLRGWGSFQVGAYQDDAIYLVLARSLAAGDGYGLINEPGPPPTPKYPFGFPLILASLGSIGTQAPAATVVPLAATLLNLTLLVWGWPLLSPTTSRWWGVAVAWIHGVSPMIIGHTRMLMTEPVFLTFVLASLLLAEAVVLKPRARWLSAFLGVALTFTLFTRTIGIAACVAVVLRLAASRRRIGYAPLAGTLGASIAALLAILALTPIDVHNLWPSRYITELSTNGSANTDREPVGVSDILPARFSEYVFVEIRRALLPLGGGEREHQLADRLGLPLLPSIIGATIAALVGLGAWYAFRKRALSPSVMLFEIFYFGALLLWRWSDTRLLYPLQPFLAAQLLMGAQALTDGVRRLWPAWRGGTRQPIAVGVVCALLLAASLAKSIRPQHSIDFTRDLRVGATWLTDHTPPDAIVMGRYPQALYLYSGRKTIPLSARTGEDLERAFEERHIDYLLIGPALAWRRDGALDYDRMQRGLLPAVAELTARGRLTPVFESTPRELVRIYRVEPSASPRRG
jgi:hypothetical protein